MIDRHLGESATMDGYKVTHVSLIGQVVAGEEKASARFWRIYSPLLDKCASRYGIRHADLDEFRVDTMADFFKGIGRFTYDPEMSFQTYFYTIVRNRACKYLAQRQKREASLVRIDGDSEEALTDAANVENIPGDSDDFGRMEEEEWVAYMAAKAHELMRTRVPPRTYQIFNFLERGSDIADICKALSIKKTVVYEHKERARLAYRQVLAELNDPSKMMEGTGGED